MQQPSPVQSSSGRALLGHCRQMPTPSSAAAARQSCSAGAAARVLGLERVERVLAQVGEIGRRAGRRERRRRRRRDRGRRRRLRRRRRRRRREPCGYAGRGARARAESGERRRADDASKWAKAAAPSSSISSAPSAEVKAEKLRSAARGSAASAAAKAAPTVVDICRLHSARVAHSQLRRCGVARNYFWRRCARLATGQNAQRGRHAAPHRPVLGGRRQHRWCAILDDGRKRRRDASRRVHRGTSRVRCCVTMPAASVRRLVDQYPANLVRCPTSGTAATHLEAAECAVTRQRGDARAVAALHARGARGGRVSAPAAASTAS